MKIIGLTGSIAMGKSTAAAMLRRMGCPVFYADQIVRDVTNDNGVALPQVKAAFPFAFEDQKLNRARLAEHIFRTPAEREKLEALLHPYVDRARAAFLARHRVRGDNIVFLDIPLLFEKNLSPLCHAVLVVSSPAFLQEERALARINMTKSLFADIRKNQMPEAEKKKRADWWLVTGLDKAHTWRTLSRIVKEIRYARNCTGYRNNGA